MSLEQIGLWPPRMSSRSFAGDTLPLYLIFSNYRLVKITVTAVKSTILVSFHEKSFQIKHEIDNVLSLIFELIDLL